MSANLALKAIAGHFLLIRFCMKNFGTILEHILRNPDECNAIKCFENAVNFVVNCMYLNDT